MWGTRRIGPDLARESRRRPRDWQLAHLWNPRHVVPDSVMPGYPWLFDGSPTRPAPRGARPGELPRVARARRPAGGPVRPGTAAGSQPRGGAAQGDVLRLRHPPDRGEGAGLGHRAGGGRGGAIRPAGRRGLRPRLRRLPRAGGSRGRARGGRLDPGPSQPDHRPALRAAG